EAAGAGSMSLRWSRIASRAGLLVLWLLLALFLLFPFYYALVSSFRPGSDIFQPAYWLTSPTFDNYRAVMTGQPFARNILNSVLVATLVTVLSLALATFAAFALGRVKFAGRRLLLYHVLGVAMFPQVLVQSGLFEFVRHIALYAHLFA